jgi:hypothetical protein
MRGTRTTARIGLTLVALTPLLATLGMTGSASGATSCAQVPTVYGIPPWGFHTGSYSGESSFAKGHGNINLGANTVSGVMCQQDRGGVIIMSVQHHLGYHSHYAMMWGYPGNIMKIEYRLELRRRHRRSRDPLRQLQRRAQRQRPVLLPGSLQAPGSPLPRNPGQQPGSAAVGPSSRGGSLIASGGDDDR